jgi:uncharacterized membrane protein YvbJ
LKKAYSKSNNDIEIEELVKKLVNYNTSANLINQLIYLCSWFYDPDSDYDKFNLKSAKEIKLVIQDILDNELPF